MNTNLSKNSYTSEKILSLLDALLLSYVNEDVGVDSDEIREVLALKPAYHSAEQQLNETRDEVFSLINAILLEFNDENICFSRLCNIFELNQSEIIILLACVANSIDLRYEHIFSYIQNGKVHPSADTLLVLAVGDGSKRIASLPLLQKDGRLMRNCLIEPTKNDHASDLTICYQASPGVTELLIGSWRSEIYTQRAVLTKDPVSNYPEMSGTYRFDPTTTDSPMAALFGSDFVFHIDIAAAVAQEHGKHLLQMDLSNLKEDEVMKLLRFALRDAAMLNCILFLHGIDELIDSAGILSAAIGNICGQSSAPVIFSCKRKFIFEPNRYNCERLLLPIQVQPLTGTQRYTIWEKELNIESLCGKELSILSGQFVLTMAQIRSAVQSAFAHAAMLGHPLEISDLYHGARSSSLHHMSDLARHMPAKYNLEDLILPVAQETQIKELIAMAHNRSLVLEEWGLGKKLTSGYGISALFTGPPGTGKTLSAQVISGSLGLDLYRIDLSTIVSKYIGETEKNLEKIFTEAHNSNVILFFDEADTLFGKRSDVGDSKDRYANIEVGYLLQRIEIYDGIVLLATNLGANLDEAFTRRLNFVVDFPFPDEETRLQLWQRLIPNTIEKSDDIDLAYLAKTYRIAGGNIRNSIVTGVYSAAERHHKLCQEDLLHGIEREYQKMGRVYRN